MSKPLVSIVIPAYRSRFFPEAFESARRQDYGAIEILVLDDSPGAEVGEVVRAAADPRVRYERHEPRLGFEGNFTRGFHAACGEYIKFLNDDDRLHPSCVRGLMGGFLFDERVTLSTSRRAVIDEAGAGKPDMVATLPLAHVSCLIPGHELADFVLINSQNVIGEPTTVLLRAPRASSATPPSIARRCRKWRRARPTCCASVPWPIRRARSCRPCCTR